MQGFGVVKSVISGDTLIILGNSKTGVAPEIQLTLAYCMAPRVARGPEGIEEPFGWEAREFLRKTIIGKPVKFRVLYKVDAIDRTFADLSFEDTDICRMMVENGWCKVRPENKVSGGDLDLLSELTDLEDRARVNSVGCWNNKIPTIRSVNYSLENPEDFFKSHKETPLVGLIEQVRDGSSVRLLLPEYMVMINFHLSGIQAPKTEQPSKTPGEPATPGEPCSKEARQFFECRLLNRSVLTYLDGLDKFNNFYGHIEHPKGDITLELLKAGLARCVDWSLNYRSTTDAVIMRKMEMEAKQKKIGIWKQAKTADVVVSSKKTARVMEVVSGDTLTISYDATNPLAVPVRVNLSSIRAPKLGNKKAGTSDEKWALEAKETLRKLCIGKDITVKVDYTRTVSGLEGEVTYTYITADTTGKNPINLAEEMAKRGLVSVMRHKPDDDCSSVYDQLLIAESIAKDTKKCMYSPREYTPNRSVDLTENSQTAKSYFTFLKRNKNLTATILYIGNGSRYRVYVPKENCECIFILEGIKSPATKTGKEKSEPFAEEAVLFARYYLMQREVSIEINGQDKTGNIIGSISIDINKTKTDFAAYMLLNGYATIQEFSIDRVANKDMYIKNESIAKQNKSGLWANYIAPTIKKVEEVNEELYSGLISYAEGNNIYVQTQRDIERLAGVETELNDYNTKANVAAIVKKSSIYVIYDKNNKKFSRIRIEDAKKDGSAMKYSIYYLDYGNRDIVTNATTFYDYTNTNSIPPLTRECRLAFVHLPPETNSFYDDVYNGYLDMIEDFSVDKQLNIHVLGRDPQNHLLILVSDPETPAIPSLNYKLAKSGFVVLDSSNPLKKYATIMKSIQSASAYALKNHSGVYIYGDIEEDEE